MTDARRLVDKLWSCGNVLREGGDGTIEHTDQPVRDKALETTALQWSGAVAL